MLKSTSDKIMLLYILILTWSGTSREDTNVERGWWQQFYKYIFFLNFPLNIILMKIFEHGSDFEIFTNI